MDQIIENVITEAKIVQNSLKFRFLSPVNRIRKAPIKDANMARRGLME